MSKALIASTMALVNRARSPSLPVPKANRGSCAYFLGECGQEQRARVGAHVHSVRDKGNGAEQQAADDLQDHHAAAKRDDHPGAAFRLLMICPEEDVAVTQGRNGFGWGGAVHISLSFQVGPHDVHQLLDRLRA